jgi:Ca-activated chloride channel family protein
MNHQAPRVTFVPSRPLLAAGRESTLDILVRIEAPPPVAETRERRLLNLAIVLDRSGSMQGAKLEQAKEAVAFAVRHMHADDLISLTIYDDNIQVVAGTAPLKESGPQILAALPMIHSGGSTALHDAWVRGGLLVTECLDPKRLNRVLLVSDGLANIGETRSDVIASHARGLLDKGVSTSTVGVGSDFNEDLMIAMAKAGGGAGWFVESPADFRRIFEAELSGLAATFGEKAVLKIEPRRHGVEVVDVLNDFTGGPDGHEIGTLVHGQPLEIVARLKIRGGEVGQPLDLFDLCLSWEGPGQGRTELRQLFRIACDDPAAVDALPIDPEVERAVGLLMAARARKEAVRFMDAGDVVMARQALGAQRGVWEARYSASSHPEDRLEADEFQRLEMLLADEKDPDRARALARKLAAYQHYQRTSRSRRNP